MKTKEWVITVIFFKNGIKYKIENISVLYIIIVILFCEIVLLISLLYTHNVCVLGFVGCDVKYNLAVVCG